MSFFVQNTSKNSNKDGQERGHYLALAFTGFGLGVLIGPPFGSVVFQFLGVEVPFYILAGIGAFDGIIQLLTYQVWFQLLFSTMRKTKHDPHIV